MFMLGTQELVIILIIVLVLFGGRKIPEIMRGLGQGMREFKKASDQAHEELRTITQDTPAPTQAPAAEKPAAQEQASAAHGEGDAPKAQQ